MTNGTIDHQLQVEFESCRNREARNRDFQTAVASFGFLSNGRQVFFKFWQSPGGSFWDQQCAVLPDLAL